MIFLAKFGKENYFAKFGKIKIFLVKFDRENFLPFLAKTKSSFPNLGRKKNFTPDLVKSQ